MKYRRCSSYRCASCINTIYIDLDLNWIFLERIVSGFFKLTMIIFKHTWTSIISIFPEFIIDRPHNDDYTINKSQFKPYNTILTIHYWSLMGCSKSVHLMTINNNDVNIKNHNSSFIILFWQLIIDRQWAVGNWFS